MHFKIAVINAEEEFLEKVGLDEVLIEVIVERAQHSLSDFIFGIRDSDAHELFQDFVHDRVRDYRVLRLLRAQQTPCFCCGLADDFIRVVQVIQHVILHEVCHLGFEGVELKSVQRLHRFRHRAFFGSLVLLLEVDIT